MFTPSSQCWYASYSHALRATFSSVSFCSTLDFSPPSTFYSGLSPFYKIRFCLSSDGQLNGLFVSKALHHLHPEAQDLSSEHTSSYFSPTPWTMAMEDDSSMWRILNILVEHFLSKLSLSPCIWDLMNLELLWWNLKTLKRSDVKQRCIISYLYIICRVEHLCLWIQTQMR